MRKAKLLWAAGLLVAGGLPAKAGETSGWYYAAWLPGYGDSTLGMPSAGVVAIP